jgi:hypothetical protein
MSLDALVILLEVAVRWESMATPGEYVDARCPIC